MKTKERMVSRQEAIDYCKSLPDTYEDYPFHDRNSTTMRCVENHKIFALIFEKEEQIWVTVKVHPEWIQFWRNTYEWVLPGFHMNKQHWNSIILNGTIPAEIIRQMIAESYDLVKPAKKMG